MLAQNAHDKIRQDAIFTMPKEELTLLLFDGAVKFLNRAIAILEDGDKDYSKSGDLIIKAQNIVREFQVTLDRSYGVAEHLNAMYSYIYSLLLDGNVKKDIKKLSEARDLLRNMRGVWKETITAARKDM
jgi:flagellar protein FliS